MDAALKAIAEPTRREILRLVRDTELTVTEIASHFPVSRPAISQHLKVLEDAELVEVRPEGNRRYYRSRADTLAEVVRGIEELWDDSLARLKVVAERDEWPERAKEQNR